MVLGTNREERRVTLQPGLDQEERAACCCANDARPGTACHVDPQRLNLLILEYHLREGLAHRFVEPQPTAVQQHLVDVGASQAPVNAAQSLIAHYDRNAVDWAAVVMRLVALVLKLALQLHANLDGLERVCCCHGPAGGDASGYESSRVSFVSVAESSHGSHCSCLPAGCSHGSHDVNGTSGPGSGQGWSCDDRPA